MQSADEKVYRTDEKMVASMAQKVVARRAVWMVDMTADKRVWKMAAVMGAIMDETKVGELVVKKVFEMVVM